MNNNNYNRSIRKKGLERMTETVWLYLVQLGRNLIRSQMRMLSLLTLQMTSSIRLSQLESSQIKILTDICTLLRTRDCCCGELKDE